jgi:hypothetical protein
VHAVRRALDVFCVRVLGNQEGIVNQTITSKRAHEKITLTKIQRQIADADPRERQTMRRLLRARGVLGKKYGNSARGLK